MENKSFKKIFMSLIAVSFIFVSIPVHSDDAYQDEAVRILKQKCLHCHGPGEDRTFLKEDGNLTEDALGRIIVPGDPDQSKLYKFVQENKMPMDGPGLSAEEKEAIRKWIFSLAHTDSGKKESQETLVRDNVIYDLILADLEKNSIEDDLKFIRYVSFAHLYIQDKNKDEAAQYYRQVLAFALNSLSWAADIALPVPIGGVDIGRAIFRIDLRDYGIEWIREEKNLWENVVVKDYPYSSDSENVRTIQKKIGTRIPFIRGDWFVSTSFTPPKYYDLLAIPKNKGDLFKELLKRTLSREEQERSGLLLRSGVINSGVSNQNRILERMESDHGALWQTFDFGPEAERDPKKDILKTPIESVEDGGEIIFHLPNGLLGYMLINAKGERINVAPEAIVRDRNRNEPIEAGISCLSCHLKEGFLKKADRVKPYHEELLKVGQIDAAQYEKIVRIYDYEKLEKKIDLDHVRYIVALGKTGLTVTDTNPILSLIDQYNLDLKREKALLELGITLSEWKELLTHENLSRDVLDLYARLETGTITRSYFEKAYGFFLKSIKGGGEVAATNELEMTFVSIPRGSFQMGSPSGESGRFNNETLHTVTLNLDFEMMRTEVTQKQWEAVMGNNPSAFKGEDLPVENVSWDDVQAFIQKLNEENDGYSYRLPTEAEWEYAARAGTQTAYSFGNDVSLLPQFGWFDFPDGSVRQTQPVAQKKPNAFGLYDIHGNVWEWVLDVYSNDYSKAVTQEKADDVQKSPRPDGSDRVSRGGSWYGVPQDLRSAYRGGDSSDGRSDNLGFRVLRTKK